MKIKLIKIKCKECNYKTQAAFSKETLPIRCMHCSFGNLHMILDEDEDLNEIKEP